MNNILIELMKKCGDFAYKVVIAYAIEKIVDIVLSII